VLKSKVACTFSRSSIGVKIFILLLKEMENFYLFCGTLFIIHNDLPKGGAWCQFWFVLCHTAAFYLYRILLRYSLCPVIWTKYRNESWSTCFRNDCRPNSYMLLYTHAMLHSVSQEAQEHIARLRSLGAWNWVPRFRNALSRRSINRVSHSLLSFIRHDRTTTRPMPSIFV
jgi:hypothetical protein